MLKRKQKYFFEVSAIQTSGATPDNKRGAFKYPTTQPYPFVRLLPNEEIYKIEHSTIFTVNTTIITGSIDRTLNTTPTLIETTNKFGLNNIYQANTILINLSLLGYPNFKEIVNPLTTLTPDNIFDKFPANHLERNIPYIYAVSPNDSKFIEEVSIGNFSQFSMDVPFEVNSRIFPNATNQSDLSIYLATGTILPPILTSWNTLTFYIKNNELQNTKFAESIN